MSPVDFKKCQCRMSLSLIYAHVEFKKRLCHICHYNVYLPAARHVEFKKVPCHPVDFRRQGPYWLASVLGKVYEVKPMEKTM